MTGDGPAAAGSWARAVSHWAAAGRRAGRSAVGVLTDFDGTLAPIVADPPSARLLPGAATTLADLARRVGLVAVVSGRPVAFLAEQLGAAAEELVLAGLYGLERLERGRWRVAPGAERWQGAVATAVGRAQRAAPAGVWVEDKGLTVTVHARGAPERMSWVEGWAAAEATTSGLRAHAGKLSVELRPPVPVDKGTVVDELTAGLRAACYLGDDLGDLPAFAALAARRRDGVATLAVAVSGAEALPEVLAAADVAVGGPSDALALLRAIGHSTGG